MRLSIIIPVFRTEATLLRCVHSITQQQFTDWEMLLIDDGSDDNAPQMCDALARQDSRIQVVHQANAGLGAARNRGMELAQGEYWLFVDSDDYLAPDTLHQLVAVMDQHTDWSFAEFPVMRWAGHATQKSLLTFRTQTFTNGWDWWFHAKGYNHCYSWNKLFRRNAFDGGVRFSNKKFEDTFIMPALLANCPKFGTTDVGLYYYCYNHTGITATAGTQLSDLLEGYVQAMNLIHWQCPPHISPRAFNDFCAEMLNVQIDVYARCGSSKLLLPTFRAMHTPKMFLQRILGMKRFCKWFNIVRKLLGVVLKF